VEEGIAESEFVYLKNHSLSDAQIEHLFTYRPAVTKAHYLSLIAAASDILRPPYHQFFAACAFA
jgi:hypothetical protein